MRLRLALFDVDGTLIDSQGHITASMEAAFAAVGAPAPHRRAILPLVGLSLPLVLSRLAPGADTDTLGRMELAYKARFRDLRLGGMVSPFYHGIRAVIDDLAARDEVLLGVATGKSRRGLRAIIEDHDLRLATAQCADDHPSKPHPAMIEAALAETGVLARDAVMIGDTTFDIEMARSAGVFAIGVGWGYHTAEALRAAGAGIVVDTPAELLPALTTQWESDLV